MKKLLVLLFVFVFLFALCGCGDNNTESDISSTSSIPLSSEDASSEISSEPSSQIISEISSNKTRITEDEAIEIASKHWGIKTGDIDEGTGFAFLIVPVNSSNDNIKIALKWFVEKQHYSTVDTIEIDPYTGEIIPYDTEK